MLILADTSIWVDHFRSGDARLASLTAANGIVHHQFVTGELAVGNLRERESAIWALRTLPHIDPVDEDGFHSFLQSKDLAGTGLGFVDVHLLAAAATHGAVQIWTRDRRMNDQASRLGLAFAPVE